MFDRALWALPLVSVLCVLTACNRGEPAASAGVAPATASAPAVGGPGGAPGAASGAAPGAAAAASAPPVSVSVVRAQKRDVAMQIEATGTVSALATVDVKPQVASVLTEVHVREGQFVAKGQPLFTLDGRADAANLARVEAQLLRDQATLADAQRQLARAQELLAKNFVSQGAVDTAQSNVEAQRASVAADRAAIEAAKVTVSYSRIVAPSAGRVGQINVFPGSSVSPTGPAMVSITQLDPIAVSFNLPQRNLADALKAMAEAGGGKPMASPGDGKSEGKGAGKGGGKPEGKGPATGGKDGRPGAADGAMAKAGPGAAAAPGRGASGGGGAGGAGGTGRGPGGDLPGALPTLAPGQVLAVLPEGRGMRIGRLEFIDSLVDPASGTVRVKAQFANKDQSLWPGAYVNINLSLQSLPGAVVVPQASIVQGARGTAVFVVDADGLAAVRPVKVLQALGTDAAVSGLKPGEKVVLDGRQNVRPGTRLIERAPDGAGGRGGRGGAGGGAGGGASAPGGAASGAGGAGAPSGAAASGPRPAP